MNRYQSCFVSAIQPKRNDPQNFSSMISAHFVQNQRFQMKCQNFVQNGQTKYSAQMFSVFLFCEVKKIYIQKGLTEVKVPFPLSKIRFFEEKPLMPFPGCGHCRSWRSWRLELRTKMYIKEICQHRHQMCIKEICQHRHQMYIEKDVLKGLHYLPESYYYRIL